MSDDQWFMAIGGHQVGPVSRDDVVTNLRNGTIDGNTLIFGPGLTNWTPLKDVPQLASFLTGASGARTAAPPPIVPLSSLRSMPRWTRLESRDSASSASWGATAGR